MGFFIRSNQNTSDVYDEDLPGISCRKDRAGKGGAMTSIYEELSGKIVQAASRGARDGARRDLGLLLFAERDSLRDLWKAAERCAPLLDAEVSGELRAAVEKLRPIFGGRTR